MPRTEPGSCLPGIAGARLALVLRGCPLRRRCGNFLAQYGPVGRRWTTDDWRAYSEATQDEGSLLAIRDITYSGRPLGSAEFTRALEKQTNRPLTPQKRRPKKRPEPANEQVLFPFDSF